MVVERTDAIAAVLRPRPVRTAVPGAPYQPGDVVRVTGSCEEFYEALDPYVGRRLADAHVSAMLRELSKTYELAPVVYQEVNVYDHDYRHLRSMVRSSIVLICVFVPCCLLLASNGHPTAAVSAMGAGALFVLYAIWTSVERVFKLRRIDDLDRQRLSAETTEDRRAEGRPRDGGTCDGSPSRRVDGEGSEDA